MGKKNSIRRIAAACEGIVRRSDEIVRRAATAGGALSELFTKKEIRVTNELCCELLASIADSASVDDLSSNHANFERMRTHVMDANDVLVARTQVNPQTMSSIMNAEDTLIDLLAAADPTARLMAGFAQQHLGVVKSVMTSFFTDLGLQLADGGRRPSLGRHLRSVMSAPVGAMVRKGSESLFARYGDGRCDRASILAFMRTLYDKGNPKLCSWPKVVRYVRNCRDEEDANYERCAEIQVRVQTWAKRQKNGIEKIWRSLAQQLKLSHGKKPRAEFAPVAIPDRCWA